MGANSIWKGFGLVFGKMDGQDLRRGWAVPFSIHQFPGCSTVVARCWRDLTDEHADNVFGLQLLRYLLEASAWDIFSSTAISKATQRGTKSGNAAPQSLALIRPHVCCDNRLEQVAGTDPVKVLWEETLSHLCVTALFINQWTIIGWCHVWEWSHLIPGRAHEVAHRTWPESRTLLIWSVPVCVCLSTVGYWLSRALDPDNEEALFQYQTRQALSVKTCCRMIGQGWHCGMWERWNQSREFWLFIHFGGFAAFPPQYFCSLSWLFVGHENYFVGR